MHSSVRAPTDVKATMNVGLRPTEHFSKLIPVIDAAERNLLNRRPGDYKSIKF